MSRYDGLIIPRSYSEYINKTDAATLSAAIAQAMQLGGVSDAYPTKNSTKIAQSGGIFQFSKVIYATDTTITGAIISDGAKIRVYFVNNINGIDNTTGLVIKYNGVDIPVKVNKNGSVKDFTAYGAAHLYIQRYTTLEFYYDGAYFYIIGNPSIYNTDDLAVYADGKTLYTKDNILEAIRTGLNTFTEIGSATGTGLVTLSRDLTTFTLLLVIIESNSAGNPASYRAGFEIIPTNLVISRTSSDDSICSSVNFTPEYYNSFLWHCNGNTSLMIDQVSGNWSTKRIRFLQLF